MPELIAKPVYFIRKPIHVAGYTLAPQPAMPIWSISVFPKGEKAVDKALKPLGLTFPKPCEFRQAGEVTLGWTGRDQAFLFGAVPPAELGEAAAVTDQSGGWAGVTVSGPRVEEVLARLLPLDLRLSAFPIGRSVRSSINHMPGIILRRAAESFELWTFRSMSQTLWHEVEEVLIRLEARAAG